jgi:hypothetical protein
MNYIKSFKLFESVDNMLQSLDISGDDLKDIFQELLDEGYEYTLRDTYLTKSGIKYNSNELIDNYYPTLLITFKRDSFNKDDIRNWDGGIYYEEQNIIETIQHCINRLKSTLSGNDVKILYSLNNINQIYIRICIAEKNPDVKLNIDQIKEYVNKKFGLDFQGLVVDYTDDYNIQLPTEIQMIPIQNRYSEIADRICRVNKNMGNLPYDNLDDFRKVLFNTSNLLLDECKKISKLQDWSIKSEEFSKWDIDDPESIDPDGDMDSHVYIMYKDVVIIKITYFAKISSKGLFKPSIKKNINLSRFYIYIDINV